MDTMKQSELRRGAVNIVHARRLRVEPPEAADAVLCGTMAFVAATEIFRLLKGRSSILLRRIPPRSHWPPIDYGLDHVPIHKPWTELERGSKMRTVFAAVWMMCLSSFAVAQSASSSSVPANIGNRANGFSYQPTPSEVIGPEVSAGVRSSNAQQEATGRELADMDRSLLRSEGLSTKSVPNFKPRQ
jgi:hypothetical protein